MNPQMRDCLILVVVTCALLVLGGCAAESPPLQQSPSSSTTTEQADSTDTEESAAATDEAAGTTSSSVQEQSEPATQEEEEAEQETETAGSRPTAVFTASPIDVSDIHSIVALGNLNPPGHVFPTDHIYFYIRRQEGSDGAERVTLHSPGDLTVTSVNAIEHVKAGIVDYNINFTQGSNLHIRLGHVSSLSEDVFGDTSSFENWEMTSEYSTGGETYRWWSRECDVAVEAGQVIGTAGGNPHQWALDFFMYDLQQAQRNVANPERWSRSMYLHGVDPLSYYEDGPVLEQLLRLVDREMTGDERPPLGSVLQDLPGTAQGCWFLQATTDTYPEDPHLALVHDNRRPRLAVLSTGNSIRGLPAGTYEFLPAESGLLNRDFGDVTPDGKTYGFEVERFSGIIIIQMPDNETVWIEALPGVGADSNQWAFSESKTVFIR